jgi:cytoskeletal protein RodZ
LRSTRESRQLSLEDVRGALGIPIHYIEALEGQTRLIADEFYLIPFLRRYADYLELDGATAVAGFLAESSRNEAAAVRSMRQPAERKRVPGWAWAVGGAGVVAAVAWFAWSASG